MYLHLLHLALWSHNIFLYSIHSFLILSFPEKRLHPSHSSITLTVHFIRYTVQLLINTRHTAATQHFKACKHVNTECWNSKRASEWGRKVSSVTSNVRWLLDQDGVVSVFQGKKRPNIKCVGVLWMTKSLVDARYQRTIVRLLSHVEKK